MDRIFGVRFERNIKENICCLYSWMGGRYERMLSKFKNKN